MSEINLGDAVRDIITGFEGIAITRQDGLFEEPSIKVQQRELNDEKHPRTAVWFEEKRLEVIRSQVVKQESGVEVSKTEG